MNKTITIIKEDLINEQWIPTERTFEVDKDAKIDENNVDHELSRMGQLIVQYGDIAMELKAEVGRKETDLEILESKLALEFRQKVDKITESKVKELVKSDDWRIKLVYSLNKSRDNYNKAYMLYKAMESKNSTVIALAYKQRAEIKTY